jgi:hypothetical protein
MAPACSGSIGAVEDEPAPSQTLGAPNPGGQPGANAPSSPGAGLPSGPVAGDVKGAFKPGPTGMRRLNQAQYANAIQDLFGAPLKTGAMLDPDEKNNLAFASIASYAATTSPSGVEQYGAAAFDIARQAVDPARRMALLGCTPQAPGDPCLAAGLKALARRAWRRPPEAAELAALDHVVKTTTAEQGHLWTGVEYAVAAILQAPSFMYAPEIGEPDPGDQSRLRFTSLEMATRLSLTLWDTIPDGELLDAGERGELVTTAGLRKQIERMLAAPRTKKAVADFFAEAFRYEGLPEQTKSKTMFPMFAPALMAAMRSELDSLLVDLAWKPGASFLDILDTREARVNKALAGIYELPPPASDSLTPALHRMDRPRAGILTAAGTMSMFAGNEMTSPTFRGLLVRERLLCQHAPDAPDSVDTDLSSFSKAKTMRERVDQHRSVPTCAACHSLMDPIGLTLENFDPIGRYRDKENGVAIDVSGDLDGKAFKGPLELAALLKADPRVAPCLAHSLYQYATGRLEGPGEEVAIDAIAKAFTAGGHSFRTLMVETLSNAGFRYAARP